MKPRVFKMGGFWIWNCREDHPGAGVGDTVPGRAYWPSAWPAALAMAQKHAEIYHGSSPADEEWSA